MTRPTAALAVALSLGLLHVEGARAQIASTLEAGALVTSRDGEVPVSTMSVTPDVRLEFPLVAFAARGSAWLTGQQWQVADGSFSTTLASPTFHGLRAELLGNASRAFFEQSIGDDDISGQARLHALFGERGGAWIGGGVARPWRIAVVSAVDVSGGGAWARVGAATISGTYTNFLFTKVLPATRDSVSSTVTCGSRSEPLPAAPAPVRLDIAGEIPDASTPTCRRYSHFSDLEGTIHWAAGLLELQGQAGYRFGNTYDVTPDSRHWAAASATLWVSSRLAAVIGGGRIPANPARGLAARNYANFGMMLAYAPIPHRSVPVPSRAPAVQVFEARTNQQGMQRIVVKVGSVESVDIMGDFSDWQPLTLVRRGRDLWELSVPMGAGIHQVNIRVDGGPWVAPPGLPTTRDSFGGETGILVVETQP